MFIKIDSFKKTRELNLRIVKLYFPLMITYNKVFTLNNNTESINSNHESIIVKENYDSTIITKT